MKKLNYLLILLGSIFALGSCSTSSTKASPDKQTVIRNVIQSLKEKLPENTSNYTIDYLSCYNFKGKETNETLQTEKQVVSIMSENFRLANKVDTQSVNNSMIGGSSVFVESQEKAFVEAWLEISKRKPLRMQSNALLMCRVGPKEDGINLRTMIVLRLIAENGNRTYSSFGDWLF